MPVVVDKDQIRLDIIEAFQRCMEDKPLTKITMRDIAAKAGISHSKILYYYNSRQEVFIAYIDKAAAAYAHFLGSWYAGAKQAYPQYSPRQLVKQFVTDATSYENNRSAVAFSQVYALAVFDEDAEKLVSQAYQSWYAAMNGFLLELYGRPMEQNAQALMVLIQGVNIHQMNNTMSSAAIHQLIDSLVEL